MRELFKAFWRGVVESPKLFFSPLLSHRQETWNGCNEDGWDLFEEETRQQFEEIARRKGYCLVRDNECIWCYADKRTEEAWRMFHVGHVKGRAWKMNKQFEENN